MEKLKILEFQDYRDYLRSLVDEKKQLLKNRFSFQIFSQSLALSKSYLKMVIDKKRHISIERIFQISSYFKLSNVENQYFIFLFLKNTSKNKNIVSFFETILQTYKIRWASGSFNNERLPENPQSLYYSFQWLQMSLAEVLQLEPNGMTAETAHQLLGGDLIASIDEINGGLLNLQKLNVVSFDSDLWKSQISCILNDPSPWDLEEVKKFKTGTRRAEIALENFEKNNIHAPARYHLYCMSLSKENCEEAIKLYDEFEMKIQELASRDQVKEDVLFVSNNVFSVIQKEADHTTRFDIPIFERPLNEGLNLNL